MGEHRNRPARGRREAIVERIREALHVESQSDQLPAIESAILCHRADRRPASYRSDRLQHGRSRYGRRAGCGDTSKRRIGTSLQGDMTAPLRVMQDSVDVDVDAECSHVYHNAENRDYKPKEGFGNHARRSVQPARALVSQRQRGVDQAVSRFVERESTGRGSPADRAGQSNGRTWTQSYRQRRANHRSERRGSSP